MKTLLQLLMITGFGLFANLALADTVWVDVRTVEEHQDDHIEGDLNLPLQSLDEQALLSTFDKDDEIILYCRSGQRAGQAMDIFRDAGFTNIINAGGINDAREQRGISPVEVL